MLQTTGEMAVGRRLPPSPCPRITSVLSGLLTATSDHERESSTRSRVLTPNIADDERKLASNP
jgi:hypothetical protein